jgi:hypothetical protein
MKKSFRGLALFLVAVAAMFASTLTLANDGLGASAPSTANMSQNPQYQAFRWVLNGVEYVQVNDLSGNVQFAVAAGGGEVLVLPVGTPALVQVVGASASSASAGATIYADANVIITVSGGVFYAWPPVGASPTTAQPLAAPDVESTCTNPANCSYAGG